VARYLPEFRGVPCEHLRPALQYLIDTHGISVAEVFLDDYKSPDATFATTAPLPIASLREAVPLPPPARLTDKALVCLEHRMALQYEPEPWKPWTPRPPRRPMAVWMALLGWLGLVLMFAVLWWVASRPR
jgi:hypothetical protein